MSATPKQRLAAGVPEAGVAPLAKLASEARDSMIRELLAEIAELRAQATGVQAAIDSLSSGLCCFDRNDRLIACNRPYADIYRLSLDQAAPGATLREIVERRFAAGSCSGGVDEYLAMSAAIRAGEAARIWITELADGRTIRVVHRPMDDGGWLSVHEDVTETPERRLPIAEGGSLQSLIDAVPDNLWVKDLQSQFVIANAATARRLGYAAPRDLIGKSDVELCSRETAQKYLADERDIIETGRSMIDSEEYSFAPNGGKFWIATTKVPLRNERDEIVGVIGVSRDVTARRLASALRDGQAQILEMIARGAPLAAVFDRLVRLVESQLSGVICSILSLGEDGRLRHSAAPNLPDAYRKAIEGAEIGPAALSIAAAAYRRETVVVVDIAVDPLWREHCELAAALSLRSCWSTPILSSTGAALGVIAAYATSAREPTASEARLIEAVTRIASIAVERKLAEDRIQFMATHDALTGLPNRALLRDRLAQAILLAKRYGRRATVAFIDLDNFKFINDNLGHNAGDELLKAVAKRMVESVRASDTVVRLGGDEFVILFFDQEKGFDETSETLRRIQAAIADPVTVDGHTFRTTASIGLATFPEDGSEVDELLANADAAMYRAKATGRDRAQLYAPGLNEKVSEKFRLREDLIHALAHGEFALLYQPQVNLRTGRIFAVEALIRWNHPSLGTLLPDRFVAIAEETGLISPIGEWVLNEACRQNSAWQQEGLPPISVSVNVSAVQFKDRRFAAIVAATLRDNSLEPRYLELELTESVIMQDVDRAVATMKELQSLGVNLSMDDFGVGYSSLGALKTFPIARLKIDKSLIGSLSQDAGEEAVTTAVISLGKKLNLKVIAEGVETADQVAFLRQLHCEEVQGFHFSAPVAPNDIEAILANGGRIAAGSVK